MFGADGLRHFDIPAALDLELDAAVALVQTSANRLEGIIKTGLNADADADFRLPLRVVFGQRIAGEAVGQAQVIGLGEGIPDGGFQAGAGMMMAAEVLNESGKVSRVMDSSAHHSRQHKLGQDVAGGGHGLRAVAWRDFDRAFAPADDAAVCLQFDQNGRLARFDAKAGFDGVEVGQKNGVQGDGANGNGLHGFAL